MMGIKRFFELRKRRRLALETIRSKGYVARNTWFSCHLCGEGTRSIHTTYKKESLAGERFTFLSQAIAYMCARCGHVAGHKDSSGKKVSIDEWTPDRLKWSPGDSAWDPK